jgi:hypothetical protein
MLDGAEDMPFFVAQTSLFLLNFEHLSKGTQEKTNIGSFSKLSLL